MNPLMTRACVTILLAATMALPANAEQSQLSKIVFGTIYHDNVSVVDIAHHMYGREKDLPGVVYFPSRSRVEKSQAEVTNSPELREALHKRGILTKNVLWVETAANGGKIVYIK